MRGFNNLDLGFLAGSEVIQVCLGKWQLQLHFDNGARVSVECPLIHRRGSAEDRHFENGAALGANELWRILGQSFVRADPAPPDRLRIEFSAGDELILRDDPQYESLQVEHGDRLLIV